MIVVERRHKSDVRRVEDHERLRKTEKKQFSGKKRMGERERVDKRKEEGGDYDMERASACKRMMNRLVERKREKSQNRDHERSGN